MFDELPEPECVRGYTDSQLDEIIGPLGSVERMAFAVWVSGRFYFVCHGRRWNPDSGDFEPSGCGPHGHVLEQSEVKRFLAERAAATGPR